MILLDVITAVFSLICIVVAIILIKRKSLLVIYILFYAFYILPLDLDVIFGMPEYTNPRHEGFYMACNDELTRIIYDIGLIWTQLFILLASLKLKDTSYKIKEKSEINLFPLLFFLMIIPAILSVVVLHNIGILYTFQWNEMELFPIHRLFSYVEELSYIGVCCSILILFQYKRKFKYIINFVSLLFLYINICIEGKRGILFFALVVIMIVYFYRLLISERKIMNAKTISIITILIAVVVFMIYFSINVKMERGYAENLLYDALRVDFFRDDRVRIAIFSELYPERLKMLDYPLQTFIHNIFQLWPLNLLVISMGMVILNYQQFLSAAVQKTQFDLHGYMTPSLFGEWISNIGIVMGILAIPFICLWFSKKIKEYPFPLDAMIICSFLLLNMFSMAYIILFLETTIILCFIYNVRKKKRV